MRKKGTTVFLMFTILSLIGYFCSDLLWASTRGTSSCEKCHTNDAVLKTLYKPPKVEAGAAVEEGEG